MRDAINPAVVSSLAALIFKRPTDGLSFEQHRFLRELPDVFGVDRVGLYLFDGGAVPRGVFTSFAGRSTSLFLREYEQLRSKDPIFRYLRHHHNGAMDGASLLGREGWKGNSLCQWLHKWKLGHTLQGVVASGNGMLATINLARAAGARSFTADEINAIQALCGELTLQVVSREKNGAAVGHGGAPAMDDSWNAPPYNASVVTNRFGDILPVSTNDAKSLAFHEGYADLIRRNIQDIESGSSPVTQRPTQFNAEGYCRALLVTITLPGEQPLYISSLSPVPSIAAGKEAPACLDELPPRTQRVAELLLKGYSNKLIAKELAVSENTIKDHVKRIFDHYGIRSRSQLANLSGVITLTRPADGCEEP